MIHSTRSHETRVTIDAAIEDVWAALTDPGVLTRWFAPKAEIQPGAGGSFALHWGELHQWNSDIEIWEPNAHLRLSGQTPLGPARLYQDFYLSSDNGQTVLRLVHSGFGADAVWDQEYEGTLGGWPCVFFCLKHMLEHHRRSLAYNFSVSGFAGSRAPADVHRCIEQLLPTRRAEALERRDERVSLLPDWHDSLFSRAVQSKPDGVWYWTQIILFDFTPSESARIESEWSNLLREAFPS